MSRVARGSWRVLVLAVAGLLLAACGGAPAITDCESTGEIIVSCKFQNPEDIVPLDDGRLLLVSEMAPPGAMSGGSLSLYDIRTDNRVPVFDAARQIQIVDGEIWGVTSCSQPRQFAPHGIDLSRRLDGRLQLTVINHGPRDRIEFFEVRPDGLQTTLQWRGCVIGARDAWFSDVVGLYRGGFMVTQQQRRSARYASVLKGLFGTGTGFVLEWDPDSGFREVPGTRGALPSGLSVSRAQTEVFVSYLLDGEVRKVARSDGSILARRRISMPDNSSWAADGRLLVAAHGGGLTGMLACNAGARRQSCGQSFTIHALEPGDLAGEPLYRHSGAPIGGVSVAVAVPNGLALGSFAADRIGLVVSTSLFERDSSTVDRIVPEQ